VGLSIANYSDSTLAKLAERAPRLAKNPIDLGPVLGVSDDPMGDQEEVVKEVVNDRNVDCATIIIYEGVMSTAELVLGMFERLKKRITKPITIWPYGPKLSMTVDISRQLDERGLPAYTELEIAIRALGALASYAKFRESLQK
jgi:acyl-CoA synthetase (NDP forming)